MKNIKSKIKTLLLIAAVAACGFYPTDLFAPSTAQAQAVPLEYAVGGIFSPGVFDIYTPTLNCGLLVTVVGPHPGVFVFAPITYNYFLLTPYHVGLSMLGNSLAVPPCPPTLYMLGSSLVPAY